MNNRRGRIISADQMSVIELKQWLSDFGEQNRQHYQKNQVQRKLYGGSIRQRIEKLEKNLPAAVSLSSTNDSSYESPPKKKPATEPPVSPKEEEDRQENFQDAAATPVFRSFHDEEEATAGTNDKGSEQQNPLSPKELENYRVVSIEKLLVAPKPKLSLSSLDDNFDESSAHPWDESSSWHPNARSDSHFDVSEETVSAGKHDNEEEEALETASVGMNRSSFGQKLARRLKRSSKDANDANNSKTNGGGFRRKFPLLLCKSPHKEQQSAPPTLQDFAQASSGEPLPPSPRPEPAASSPSPQESPLPTSRMHNATLFQDNTLTSDVLDMLCNGRIDDAKYHHQINNNNINLEETTVSTWSEDSGMPSIAPNAIDHRLNEIFAQESDSMNQRDAAAMTMASAAALAAATTTVQGARQGESCGARSARSKLSEHISMEPSRLGRQRLMMKPPVESSSSSSPAGPNAAAAAATESSHQSDTSLKEEDGQEQVTPSVADSNNSSDDTSSSSSSSSSSPRVSDVVQQFGGGNNNKKNVHKAAIQRRVQQLEQKWAAERPPMHIKKVKWQVCQSSGKYKKQVVLDYYQETTTE